MNVQQIQLVGSLLQLVGWMAPVVVMAMLLFRINIRFGVGIGGARVLSGGVVMLLVLLFHAFWQYQFGTEYGLFQIIAFLVLLAGSGLVFYGSAHVFDNLVKDGTPPVNRRERKKLLLILLLMWASFGAVSIAFAVFRMAPIDQLANYTLFNLNISIAASLYVSFGLLRLPVFTHDRLGWSRVFFFAAGGMLLVQGIFRTYHLEFQMHGHTYLYVRLVLSAILAVIGTAAILLGYAGAVRMEGLFTPAVGKETIMHYKLNVQKRFILVLSIAVIVIGGTGYVILEVIQSGRHSIEDTYLNEQRKVAESVAANMEGINDAMLMSLKDLAVRPGIQAIKTDSMRKEFANTYAIWKNVVYSVSRTDEHGILRYAYPEVPGTAGRDISSQLHVQRFLRVKDTIFTGVFKSVQGKYTFGMYVPVYERSHDGRSTRFAGGVAFLIHIHSYAIRAFRNTSIFTPNPLAAINSAGRLIISSNASLPGVRAEEYLRNIFPMLTNRDSLTAVTDRIASLSAPQFVKILNSPGERNAQWLVAHPVGFSQKIWGVVILPVSNSQIYSVYTETVGKQLVLWGLFAVVLVLLMSSVVIIFYRWSRFLEEEVNHELMVVRQAEGRYAKLFNEAVVGIFQTTTDGRLISVNPSMAAMLGYSSTAALMASEVFRTHAVPDAGVVPWDEIQKGAGMNTPVAIRKADGSVMNALVHCKAVSGEDGSADRYEGFIEDITERKRLEQQLMQAQKLEGIGTLAGGIAHDFNNLLAMILGSAELMRLHSLEYPQLKKYVDRIIEATERGASISRQLLIFSRPDQAELKPVSPAQIISELEEMLKHFLPKSVTIESRIEADHAVIMGDPGHLHQAMLNLALNANDAMPDGGTLVISERIVDFDTVQKKFPSSEPASYVAIAIADTGMGMDESVKAKMFDPFFSTKERGKGTGLGLAIVHGIVKSHKGFIEVESVPKKGTVFTLYFPVIDRALTLPQEAPASAVREASGTILLVDDEELIREMLGEHLAEEGYSVLMASDGKEALRLYEANRSAIDVVITDLGMPEMGGEELYHRLRLLDPDVKVMVSSGYLDKTTKENLEAQGICGVLTKPYRLEHIQSSLRALL